MNMTETLDQAVWKVLNRSTPRNDEDIRIGDITSCWGVHWALLAAISWFIWCERNRRQRQHDLRPPEVIVKEAIKDVSIYLNTASFNKSNQSLIDKNAHNSWEANILRKHPRNIY